MASISVAKYTSADSYTVTISGLTVGRKYHLFIEDLTSGGASNGWYCRYTQTATSTSFTYTGSTSATFSRYARRVRLYCTGTASTSHSVGTLYSTSELPSSNVTGAYTATISAWSGGSTYSTNKIYFRTGVGVQKYTIVYSNATKDNLSATISSNITSTVLNVRAGTNAQLYDVDFEDGYGTPTSFSEYGDSTFSPSDVIKTFSDGKVSSNGTRYIKLHATVSQTYYYRVIADANNGAFADGTTRYATATREATNGIAEYSLSRLPTPTRLGYRFLGWGGSASATIILDDTLTFSATSTDSSNPTEKTVYAIWERIKYTAYVKLGAGVSSAMVYVDGVAKSDIRDKEYHGVTMLSDSVIEFRSIGKTSGYDLPYTLSFYTTATSATPSRQTTHNTDTVSFNSAGMNMWCVLSAAKDIGLFYWDSASTDASLIAAGQPISNLTAARWNKLKAKIKELADAWGSTYTYTEVSEGDAITADEFNDVRTAISNRTGHGTLPAAQSKGNAVKAALFEGSGSLKSALNAAITHYNNS